MALGYQGRKAARTTTLLFLADSRGQLLACARLRAGNHHDLFDVATSFGEVCTLLEVALNPCSRKREEAADTYLDTKLY